MPIVRIHGADVEVPRHVHRADGSSKIVWTEEECVAADADGWCMVPPSADALPAEPESVAPAVAETEPEPTHVDATMPFAESAQLDAAFSDLMTATPEAEEIAPVEPQTPTYRYPKRGRPRKVQP